MTLWRNLVVALVAAFALAACSSSNDPEPMAMPDPEPTPEERCTADGGVWTDGSCISAADDAYNTALAAIAEAETEAQAQAAVNAAVEAGISAAQLRALNAAVTARTDALAAAAAAAQRAMLVAGAMCEATTEECVAAHNALIAALQGDVNRLAADADATNAQQEAAQEALDAAIEKRDMVQMAMDELDRTTTAGREVGEAMDAARGLETDRSAEAIAAAKVEIEEARQAAGDDDSYAERIAMAQRYVDRAEERNVVDMAVMAATTAADGLTESSDADAVTAAQALIDAAKMAVADAEHLTDAEKAAHNATITSDERLVTLAKNRNDAAEAKRLADEKAAEDEEKRKANEAMAATAAKLYAGISAPSGTAGSPAVDDRIAAYNADDTAIVVSVDVNPDDTTVPTPINLSEDEDTTVAANHGWTGKRYADPAGGDMVEAYVYSNVAAPEPGDKFGQVGVTTPVEGYEYGLNSDGELAITSGTNDGANVAFTGVTRTAGTETFHLPDPNDVTQSRIRIPGSYHGVSGNYYCTPGTPADGCSAAVAEEGFTLAGNTWTFRPGNPEARVMDSADTDYASYGWWLRKAANDGPFVASAFVGNKGDAPAALDATDTGALRGTATYMGGAAGKYALASSTGGTNDAGHFTARATLNATFAETHQISGTIDNFIGADGQSREWSIKLNDSIVSDAGVIAGDPDDTNDTGAQMTVWTIGDGPAAASGQWSGVLQEAGDDNVPQVATGTFYTEYGTAGRMVGAFGANVQ